jgi:hypothetical protein
MKHLDLQSFQQDSGAYLHYAARISGDYYFSPAGANGCNLGRQNIRTQLSVL